MHPVLRRYVDEAIASAEGDPRFPRAGLRLWMFAEMTLQPSRMNGGPYPYAEDVPDDLLALELSQQEWAQFREEVREVIDMLPDSPARAGLIKAVTTAAPWDAVETVMGLLCDHKWDYPPDQVNSLLSSLSNIIWGCFPNPPVRLEDPAAREGVAHVGNVFREYDVQRMLDMLVGRYGRLYEKTKEVREVLKESSWPGDERAAE